MADIRYIDDTGRLRVAHLIDQGFTIGRAQTCHISFSDDMVSREHARVERDPDGRFRVRDLGSRNRTRVNGQQETDNLLRHGDIIRVGDHALEFLDERENPEMLSLDFLTPDRKEPIGCEWLKLKTPLSLSLPQIERLARVSASWTATGRANDIADAALGRIIIELGAERGFIARRGQRKGELIPIAHRGLSLVPGGSRMPASQAFISAAVLQSVAGRYPQAPNQLDPQIGYAATGMVAPLLYRNEIIGMIYVDNVTSSQVFSSEDLQEFTAAGTILGCLLGEASSRIQESATQMDNSWLMAARRLQESLMVPLPDIDGMDIQCQHQPGAFRCGDLYDVFETGKGKVAVLLTDCGGGGAEGFSQSSMIRGGMRGALKSEDSEELGTVFNRINKLIAQQKSRRQVTCLVMIVDVPAGKVYYINSGGMPPMLLSGPGRLVTLDQPSLLLGVDPDYEYEVSNVELSGSFRLVAFSDGVTDCVNSKNDVFGEEKLHDLLLDNEAFEESSSLLKRIDSAVAEHAGNTSRSDDGTVLIVSRS